MIEGVTQQKKEIDAYIEAVLENWKFSRLAETDKNVLRIGVFELMNTRDPVGILINEAIARIPNVNFYCYGYTDNELCVYAENGRTSKWALSATSSKGGTPTGKAMQLAADRIRRFTKDPVLMLVLTDGAPNSSAEVIRQDNELRTKGFFPIGIGIQSNTVSRTFKEYIVMEDISALAVDLGKMTKKKLDRMLVRKDSSA